MIPFQNNKSNYSILQKGIEWMNEWMNEWMIYLILSRTDVMEVEDDDDDDERTLVTLKRR